MANVCDQNVYIFAATAGDMKVLLEEMARHFKKVTDVDCVSGIGANADWKTYADSMASASMNYNMLCFLADEPDTRAESGWLSSGEEFGKPYVALTMGLKWGPSFQVAEFCNSLDREKYGCATINGGEYMCAVAGDPEDEIAYIQWGESMGGPFDGGLQYDEYVEWGKKVKTQTPMNLQEMSLRKLFESESAGSFFWSHQDDDDGYYYGSMGFTGSYWNINWRKPSATDLDSIDDIVSRTLAKFPWVVAITGSTYEGREANVEGLVPGDMVKLVSDWNTQYFDPVGIAVYTADGKRLGNLDGVWGMGMGMENYERSALACILPHIKAYAELVQPLSTRDGRSRHSSVTVRLEITDDPIGGIYDEVHDLLKKGLNQRELTSDLKEAM